MGYNSNFKLTLLNPDGSEFYGDEIPIWEDIVAQGNYFHSLEDEWSEGMKWYDCKQDMKAFSRRHPDILFFLEREGEECPDLEHMFFLNGKMQSVEGEVTYAPYDPKELE